MSVQNVLKDSQNLYFLGRSLESPGSIFIGFNRFCGLDNEIPGNCIHELARLGTLLPTTKHAQDASLTPSKAKYMRKLPLARDKDLRRLNENMCMRKNQNESSF